MRVSDDGDEIVFAGGICFADLSVAAQNLFSALIEGAAGERALEEFGCILSAAALGLELVAGIERALAAVRKTQVKLRIIWEIRLNSPPSRGKFFIFLGSASRGLASGFLFRNPLAVCLRSIAGSYKVCPPVLLESGVYSSLGRIQTRFQLLSLPVFKEAQSIVSTLRDLGGGIKLPNWPMRHLALLRGRFYNIDQASFIFLRHSGVGLSSGFLAVEGAELNSHVNVFAKRISSLTRSGEYGIGRPVELPFRRLAICSCRAASWEFRCSRVDAISS